MSNDTRPLFVLVLGPATDVALALQARPEIASRLTVVWIGGNPYPKGGWEYNLYNDPQAGRILFASKAPLWQVPHNVYRLMRALCWKIFTPNYSWLTVSKRQGQALRLPVFKFLTIHHFQRCFCLLCAHHARSPRGYHWHHLFQHASNWR
ncbi:nucleoside hydrolase [Erwinia sp. MYb535]|uniref:nucleoside hydrolase n=1 Tax=Erwinia sp. MYb535 TaxID=2745309 RepID=UPI0030957E01